MRRDRSQRPISAIEAINAVVTNPLVYALAEHIPLNDRAEGGRPRMFPSYMYIIYGVLRSKFTSARAVETELREPLIWNHLRALVVEQFPKNSEMHLPTEPMKRHHFVYVQQRYLRDREVLEAMRRTFTEWSCRQAVELGFCDPDDGTWTHPALTTLLYGDGTVVRPLYKTRAENARTFDPQTGEVFERRYDADASDYRTGGGTPAFGLKFNFIALRGEDTHERVIVNVDHAGHDEAGVSTRQLEEVAPYLPGAKGVIYDGALRGTHLDRILAVGLIPLVKSPSAPGGGPKEATLGRVAVTAGKRKHIDINLVAGHPHTVTRDEAGEPVYLPLKRAKTMRRANADDYRFYSEYGVPATLGGGTVLLAHRNTKEDKKRDFNRTENLRVISTLDPDWALAARRNDSESINSQLKDTLWGRRAHSVGRNAQLFDMLNYGVYVNSISLARYGGVSEEVALAA